MQLLCQSLRPSLEVGDHPAMNFFSLANTLVALRFYLAVIRYSQRDLTDQLLPQTPFIFSPLRCADLKYDKLRCYGFVCNPWFHKILQN